MRIPLTKGYSIIYYNLFDQRLALPQFGSLSCAKRSQPKLRQLAQLRLG
jgi:hypothetical protein